MSYKVILPATQSRPKTQAGSTPSLTGLFQALGSNFSMSTLMLAGACIQATAILLFPNFRYILLPGFALLAFRIIDAYLQAYNIIPNRYMQNVFKGRMTALIPDKDGVIHENKREKVVILLLGAKSNHPFGFFAPQFSQVGKWLFKMQDQFDSKDAPEGRKLSLF